MNQLDIHILTYLKLKVILTSWLTSTDYAHACCWRRNSSQSWGKQLHDHDDSYFLLFTIPHHRLTFRNERQTICRGVWTYSMRSDWFMFKSLPMLCRTRLQITKWSSFQRPGAVTPRLSKSFSKTISRMLKSMLLSILNQMFWLVRILTCSPIFSTPRLDKREDGGSIQEYLYEKTNQKTVPNVFVSAYTMVTSS